MCIVVYTIYVLYYICAVLYNIILYMPWCSINILERYIDFI